MRASARRCHAAGISSVSGSLIACLECHRCGWPLYLSVKVSAQLPGHSCRRQGCQRGSAVQTCWCALEKSAPVGRFFSSLLFRKCATMCFPELLFPNKMNKLWEAFMAPALAPSAFWGKSLATRSNGKSGEASDKGHTSQ